MKPETEGKLMVAMLISILAFGFGTGAVMVTGHLESNSPITLNTSTPADFPVISNSYKNNDNSTSTSYSPDYSQNNNPSTSHNNTSYTS